jgi:hypothetical protein
MYFTINCPYMIQHNRHLQGAYTKVVYTYYNKIVDRILWSGVLCLVTWCVAIWELRLSISQKALGTLPEDGNEMPKHVGATTHN